MIFELPQQQQVAPAPGMVIVERVKDHEPLFLMGFVAFGVDEDLARLDKAAAVQQLKTARVPNADGQLESMVFFTPGMPRTAAMQLFHDATGGKYGKLRVEAMIVSVKDAADGIDYDKEVYMLSPDTIGQ